MPVLFEHALDAVRMRPASKDAQACVRALERQDVVRGHKSDKKAQRRAQGTPALNALHRNLRDDAGCTLGRLLVSILRAHYPNTIAGLVAHLSKAKRRYTASEVAELHADCMLALDAWVVCWNRNQIREVDG